MQSGIWYHTNKIFHTLFHTLIASSISPGEGIVKLSSSQLWMQFSKILIFILLLVTNFVISFPWSAQVHIIHFDVKNAKSSGINNPSLSVMHSLKWKWCSVKKTSEFSSTPSITGVLLLEVSTGDQYEEVLSLGFLIFTYKVKKMWSQGSKINNCFFFFLLH